MKNEIEAKYAIDSDIIKNYVETMNAFNEPMSKIKTNMPAFSKPMEKFSNDMKSITNQITNNMNPIYKSINMMSEALNRVKISFPNEQSKVMTSVIKQIMEANNGIISSRMIEPLKISRQYLSDLEKSNEIEKVTRGIYISPNVFEDSFYSFQSKYKKAIFSHMNALYFYGMTEEFPYNYTVTVPQSYHVDAVNEKCNVFYVADEVIELGLSEIDSPNGNKVRAYDIERSICDIIKSKNRMDLEQVKKTIRKYMKSENKNMSKLSEYAEKMNIKDQVMEMVGMYND